MVDTIWPISYGPNDFGLWLAYEPELEAKLVIFMNDKLIDSQGLVTLEIQT